MRLVKFYWRVLSSNLNILSTPYKLNFAVTYKCNLRCRICNIWKKKSRGELSLDEIRKFSAKNRGFSWISFTGGEPFLRKDIVNIADAFNQNSNGLYLLNIPTNGYVPKLITKRVEEMIELNIPRIIITPSLDGPEKTHDKIRGRSGSWKRVMETFTNLRELASSNKNLDVFFALTISPLNVGKFEETFNSIKDVVDGITINDFHINIFHFSEHFYSNLEIPKKNYSTYKKDLIRELGKIERMKGRSLFDPIKFIERKYLELGKRFVRTGKTPVTCKAVDVSVFMDPIGDVYPCTIFCRKLGNIRNVDYDLTKILGSETSRETKKTIRGLGCPNCWTPCEVNQMMMANMADLIQS
jgi:radical SAM protein with 4Fe4S-binding SPASM domain